MSIIVKNRSYSCFMTDVFSARCKEYLNTVFINLTGRGDLGTICTSSSTVNVVNLAGLAGAGTIAHEVFHKYV